MERLEYELDEGLFTRGVQAAIAVGGERLLDLALGDTGLAEPMTREHVFRVYCTIKPITAIAIARLVDQGVLDLDEPLEARLPAVRALAGGVALRHILTHTAGLHRPMGWQMEAVAPAKRRALIEQWSRPTAWRVGFDAAYSEYAGWHVLGWLIEEVTGEPLREHLRAAVLDPLGLHDTWIGMTADEYPTLLPRLGINHHVRDMASYPMLFERSRRVCMETNPAHGGYTTARDLAHFYTQLLDQLTGRDSHALPAATTLAEFCTDARPPVYDHVLDCVCPYGLGFMTSLPSCSAASFGHSGNVAASFAFADPERNLSVAVVFNGIVSYDAAFLRRQALVTAIYDDMDRIDDAESAAAPPAR